MVDRGYELRLLHESSHEELYTVFSAAAYPAGEGDNLGALLRLRGDEPPVPITFEGRVEGGSQGTAGARPVGVSTAEAGGESVADRTFVSTVARHRGRLHEAFARRVQATGSDCTRRRGEQTRLPLEEWASVLREVLPSLTVEWEALQPAIAPTVKRAAVGTAAIVDT
mgnify:CR=1 FL=1